MLVTYAGRVLTHSMMPRLITLAVDQVWQRPHPGTRRRQNRDFYKNSHRSAIAREARARLSYETGRYAAGRRVPSAHDGRHFWIVRMRARARPRRRRLDQTAALHSTNSTMQRARLRPRAARRSAESLPGQLSPSDTLALTRPRLCAHPTRPQPTPDFLHEDRRLITLNRAEGNSFVDKSKSHSHRQSGGPLHAVRMLGSKWAYALSFGAPVWIPTPVAERLMWTTIPVAHSSLPELHPGTLLWQTSTRYHSLAVGPRPISGMRIIFGARRAYIGKAAALVSTRHQKPAVRFLACDLFRPGAPSS
jgi:hypothetical protein